MTFYDWMDVARKPLSGVSLAMVIWCQHKKDQDGQVRFLLWTILFSL